MKIILTGCKSFYFIIKMECKYLINIYFNQYLVLFYKYTLQFKQHLIVFLHSLLGHNVT